MRSIAKTTAPFVLALLGAYRSMAAEPAVTPTDDPFVREIRPLVVQYCAACHGGTKPKADLALDSYHDAAALAADRRVWEGVLENLRTHVMPPEGKPQPSASERQWLVKLIEAELERHQGPRSPGRVTMRRLNRAEYNNTIRDLMGVDVRLADDFPSDDVGYGFDNIGDVLSLPPILFEKYLAAAEKIATTAVLAPETASPLVTRIEAGKLHSTVRQNANGDLNTNGELFTDFEFARPGQYKIRLSVHGDQAGNELPHLVVKLGDSAIGAFDIAAKRHSPREYHLEFTATPGKQKLALAFANDFYDPGAADPHQRDRNLTIDWIEIVSPRSFAPEDLPATHRRLVTCRPNEPSQRLDCARQIVHQFAGRAFRRPPQQDEVDRLARLVTMATDAGDSFERGVQLAVQATLISPYFLFRVEKERPADDAQSAYALDDYELASRLSYFLWSSMPDDELFAAASKGNLRLPEALAQQAKRMLADRRAQAFVENFSGQWLQTRNLSVVSPAGEVFDTFDQKLADDMRTETEMLFAAIVREDRSILDFLDADFTFVNQRLAEHYGMKDIQGNEFRRVTLDDRRRGGVVTLASVLTVTSNPTRTSPVKRGKWILENIFGAPPPPPPPDVPELNESKKAMASAPLRVRLEAHRAIPACASCHARMDPLGFGLENFDGIGAWREADGHFEIDASGTLPDGRTFRGPSELKALLKENKDQFAACLAEKLLTYAIGRGLEYRDKYAVNAIVMATAADGYRFSALLSAVVGSDPFTKRDTAGTIR
ncbi:MAG TPA: DUF1592 domain-containing protein [Pirellulales bacterium]|jgi:mono/diheme cytochrome c family protein|nr:DUF1592 domain-containing protein [Pirellulales bacterium]